MNTNTIREYEYEYTFLRIFKYEYTQFLIFIFKNIIWFPTPPQLHSLLQYQLLPCKWLSFKTAIKICRDADAEMVVVMRGVYRSLGGLFASTTKAQTDSETNTIMVNEFSFINSTKDTFPLH